MPKRTRIKARIHLTNVTGIGASQLLQSLLPSLEADPLTLIESIYLPEQGALSSYRSKNPLTTMDVYRRILPNAISRILECTFMGGYFDGDTPLLVLGDLPIRCRGPQTVFVQQSNLLRSRQFQWNIDGLRYWLARVIFAINLHKIHAFIVQTEVMRQGLELSYPDIVGRVHVVAQPVPSWLLSSGLKSQARARSAGDGLKLIYPAASYPHKNHALLSRLDPQIGWPIAHLILTLDACSHPAPRLPWVQCQGFLSPRGMVEAYSQVDALLFLSKEESFGFPLLEAMYVGLPIVCPDLAYAHALCGEQAIFFNPDEPQSLLHAITELKSKLDDGWWPDWRDQLVHIPSNWGVVARKMLAICCE